MAKSKQQKEQTISDITDGLKQSKSVVFANFQGLGVSVLDQIRSRCKDENVKCLVSKKTLIGKASENAGLKVETKPFVGGVAVFFGLDDAVKPAKIVSDFAKKNEVIAIFGGILDGKYIEASEVIALAKLPSRQELYAQLVGVINSPVSGFVNVLAGNIRNFVNVLNAVKEEKSKA